MRCQYPLLSEDQLYQRLLKSNLPPSLYGSSKYFKDRLADLKNMVEEYGLPTLLVRSGQVLASTNHKNEIHLAELKFAHKQKLAFDDQEAAV